MQKTLNTITNLLDLFKIFPYVEVSIVPYVVLYQNFFLCTKPVHIPQNLGNQIVFKVLNAKLQ